MAGGSADGARRAPAGPRHPSWREQHLLDPGAPRGPVPGVAAVRRLSARRRRAARARARAADPATGWNCASPYEWGQHVRLSEALDMDREEILRVAEGPEADGWSPADAVLLRAADELHEQSKISEGTGARLAESYDERALIEIAMLVGHYHLVAFALNSLEVEL